MEKRLLLAIVLMTFAMLITNRFFGPTTPSDQVVADSVLATTLPGVTQAPGVPRVSAAPSTGSADSVVVTSDHYRYVFSTRGAALRSASLISYPSYSEPGSPVQLVPEGVTDFLSYRLVLGADTLSLAALPFEASERQVDVSSGRRAVDFSWHDEGGLGVVFRYEFAPEGYLVGVTGRVEQTGGQQAYLLARLGPGLAVHENPAHHSEQDFAFVTRGDDGIKRRPFRQIESQEVAEGPLHWAAIKDKYFLAAIIRQESGPVSRAVVTPAPAATRVLPNGNELTLPRAQVEVAVPVAADGEFAFQAYLGPQDYRTLKAVGHDLENVTPYGYRWLQPVIGPLSAAVLWVLNTLHDTLGISYGWVLVIFGVMMRVVLWPLNAKAMRSQLKTMTVQPLLQEIREKYKDDPEKQQQAMVALYKEHGFNPFGGCLPLLVPFPVLITLFFVFRNTIAFRGARFLWLPDLSLPDPIYILPVLLVVSMFSLQWVMSHLSGMEQNSQMKMMMYFMPLMMGIFFFSMPSGLNVYYTVTQIASIPQQVLISIERRKAQEELKRNKVMNAVSSRDNKGKGRAK
ncbi:MAG: membrane protein insertase YidC [Gemmatimonadota bacterium]|jgi:YidC/Oxa1 family membrane protein insertase|nr:membrane protein insertase YidC [Gemmatimonadota bacterium]